MDSIHVAKSSVSTVFKLALAFSNEAKCMCGSGPAPKQNVTDVSPNSLHRISAGFIKGAHCTSDMLGESLRLHICKVQRLWHVDIPVSQTGHPCFSFWEDFGFPQVNRTGSDQRRWSPDAVYAPPTSPALGNQSGATWTPDQNTAVCGLMFLCSVCASAVQPWIHRGTTVRLGAQPSGRRRSKQATTLWCCWFSSACSPSTCLSTPSVSCWGLNLLSSWYSLCKSYSLLQQTTLSLAQGGK